MRNMAIKAVLLVFSAFSNETNAKTETWSPKTLNGVVSLHDGPNCFNAALASAGFVDDLVYIDSTEYRFYLEFYCNSTLYRGDAFAQLLAFEYKDGTIIHGALSINSEFIFEKLSTAGRLGIFKEGRIESSIYAIKKRDESPYINGKNSNQVFQIVSYKCEKPKMIRQQIADFSSDPIVSSLLKIRSSLSNLASQSLVSSLPVNGDDLTKLAKMIEQRQGSSKLNLFIVALGQSLLGHLLNLNMEGLISEKSTIESISQFRIAVDQLSTRIRSDTSDPAILRILRESLPE